ncbi:ogr/Delta-like zinc finger family protein [Providencia rettgeri]|nr:ogr/Delta-like zinc finger family protein [Providencia rettgeri]
MMNCPECGHAAHTRSSYQVSSETKERYNQCQNINCGCTFVSHESVTKIICKPKLINEVKNHMKQCEQLILA